MQNCNSMISAGRSRLLLIVLFAALWMGGGVLDAHAQEPNQRQLRQYIPPDQLISMGASTPFDTFLEFVNPVFQRVTGKTVIDPEGRSFPIGVTISRTHFLDALETVLQANQLGYRETDRYFIVQDRSQLPTNGTAEPTAQAAPGQELASIDSREVRISAILFEVNLNEVREAGINWSVLFGSAQGGQGGQGGGGGVGGGQGGQGQNQNQLRLFLRTDDLFDNFSEYIEGPDVVDLGVLSRLFRLMENDGLGETVANPTVTVQSGREGNIQIGSDIPVQVRDFAGNTVTQFFSTGIIIDVTPTVIREALVDSVGAPEYNFIHLDVLVENSSTSPSSAGAPIIDKSTAETEVLLLDGEQTVIGGLYSTDQSVSRAGIPILKDLPWWVFGLRYVFGFETVTNIQKELLIVLQAEMLDPLEDRLDRPMQRDILEKQRERIRENIGRFSDEEVGRGQTPPIEN